jgi:transposase
MDDPRCRAFFAQPQHPYQRQYEALRAVFVEGHPQTAVAKTFGYSYASLRQLVHQFRQQYRDDQPPPFFETFR